MFKFYFSKILIVLAIFSFPFHLFAQRNYDLSVVLSNPVERFVINCNDSFLVVFHLINVSSEPLVPGDTVMYQYPNLNSFTSARKHIVTDTVYSGDTVVTIGGFINYD